MVALSATLEIQEAQESIRIPNKAGLQGPDMLIRCRMLQC